MKFKLTKTGERLNGRLTYYVDAILEADDYVPDLIEETKDGLFVSSKTLYDWLPDILEAGEDYTCSLDELFDAYKAQSGAPTGIKIRGNITIIKSKIKYAVTKLGYIYVRKQVDGKRIRCVKGCKLKQDNH